MHRRRPLRALFRCQRRPDAAWTRAHLFPELVEVVRGSRVREALLERRIEVVVSGVHVGELGRPERLSITSRNLDGVEHVREADRRVVGHVGVPVLAGVGKADRLTVLDHIREIADFRHAGHLILSRHRALQASEALREVAQRGSVELLAREVQNAVAAERLDDRCKIRRLQGTREIDAGYGGAENPSGRFDF
jgi:hypothetical protein